MASKAQDRTLFVPGRSLGSTEWAWEAGGLAPTLASLEPPSSHFPSLGPWEMSVTTVLPAPELRDCKGACL